MNLWSFYDPETGFFDGRTFSGPARMLEANTPAGMKAIIGKHDHMTRRIDPATGEVVERQQVDAGSVDVTELQWRQVRMVRDMLLQSSDWRVTRAAETGEPVRPQWKEYRRALRDITMQSDPFSIQWPEAPK